MISGDRGLVAMLEACADVAPVSERAGQIAPGDPHVAIETLRHLAADIYRSLAPEVAADLKWQGCLLESCPSSNVLAGGIRGYRAHPVRSMGAPGLLFA